jgi:hypothetical protein
LVGRRERLRIAGALSSVVLVRVFDTVALAAAEADQIAME